MDITDIPSRYAVLNELHKSLRNPTARQQPCMTKSSAQVARSVRQDIVRPNAGGLKPNEYRGFRITVRFSGNEREILVIQAEKSGLTMSDHIRIAALGPTYAYAVDPERYQLLKQAIKGLNRQGTNLNQIAHRMNARPDWMADSESMLGKIAQSLMDSQKAVRQALSEGRTYE